MRASCTLLYTIGAMQTLSSKAFQILARSNFTKVAQHFILNFSAFSVVNLISQFMFFFVLIFIQDSVNLLFRL